MFLFLVAGGFSAHATLKKVAAKKVLDFPGFSIDCAASIPAGSASIVVTVRVGPHVGWYYVSVKIDDGDIWLDTKPFVPISEWVAQHLTVPLIGDQSSAGNHIVYGEICADLDRTDCADWIQTKFVAE
jgi:hypothetical protein